MLGAAFDLVCSLRPLPLCGGVSVIFLPGDKACRGIRLALIGQTEQIIRADLIITGKRNQGYAGNVEHTVFIARIGRLPDIQYSGKLCLRFVRILTHIAQSPIHEITSTTL